MNAFGDFLYALRKERGMTQVELADILGVTNKAVSKWETGEAMPETSLLIPISEVFGVTVDELLNGRRNEGSPAANEDERPHTDEVKKHLFTRGKDDIQTRLEKISGVVCAAVVLVGIATYLFFGALKDLWHPYWIIIPESALLCGVIAILFGFIDKEKLEREKAKGKNPYTDGLSGLVMLVSIMAYLFLGVFTDLWHPYWVIIILGGAAAGIIGAVGSVFAGKDRKDR